MEPQRRMQRLAHEMVLSVNHSYDEIEDLQKVQTQYQRK
jgi:hypothetical protein